MTSPGDATRPSPSNGAQRPRTITGQPEVFAITGAQDSLTDDQNGRTKRYLMSMTVRTVCVLLAIVVPGWPRWALIAGAVILPYLAVVIANGGRKRKDAPSPVLITTTQTALPQMPTTLLHDDAPPHGFADRDADSTSTTWRS